MYLKNKLISLFLLLFILACEPVEIISPLEYDISKLAIISINSNKIKVNSDYNPVFSEFNIEDQLKNPPILLIQNWVKQNIRSFGNQNEFVINILDASITKKEIDNLEAKKYEEKKIYLYEVFFLVEYELYDDAGYLLANTTVESSRSTTSQIFISLNETELIINDLVNKSLFDFINETKSMIQLYMQEYTQ
tara:strand:- start:2520 stop:3095 length:576 start_codon:yes stop_codon:yes gene_type:complete